MERIKELLKTIGFGKNEAEIYISLLKNGNSTALDLAKQSKIHRSNIYDSLRHLIDEGFVYEVKDNTSVTLFAARPSSSIANFLKQKETELNSLLKDYEEKAIKSNELKIKVSRGSFALREAILALLKTDDPIYAYGIPTDASEKIGPILKDFHKERIKRKIIMKHIYNSGSDERVKYLNKFKYTEAKVLPKKYDSYATTIVSGNEVTIFLWEDEIKVIEINEENMAKPYAHYFEILWEKAQKN